MDNYGESNRLQVTNPDSLPISTSELFLLLGKVIARPMAANHTGPRGSFTASEPASSVLPSLAGLQIIIPGAVREHHTQETLRATWGGGPQSQACLLTSLNFISKMDSNISSH